MDTLLPPLAPTWESIRPLEQRLHLAPLHTTQRNSARTRVLETRTLNENLGLPQGLGKSNVPKKKPAEVRLLEP